MQQVNNSMFKKFIEKQRILILLIFLLLATMTLIPNFGTVNNIMKVVRQVAVNGITAAGMTFVIMTGGIDISVGSTLALGGMVTGMAAMAGVPLPIAIVLGMASGGLTGALNGYFVAFRGMLPFVVTLGMMNIIRGFVLIISNASSIWGLPDSFLDISANYVWVFPIPVIILVVTIAVAYIILRFTSFGRRFLAVGGNEEASRLAGINTRLTKMWAYIICGILSALAGIILASRLGSCQPTAGEGNELDAIAAVVVGGTSLNGGIGSISGTLWGALIIGVLNSALNQIGVQSFVQQMVSGGIILLAVLFDTFKKRD